MNKNAIGIGIAIVIATGVYYGANYQATKIAKENVDQMISEIKSKDSFTYGSVSASAFSKNVSIKDIKITEKKGKSFVTIEQIDITGIDSEQKITDEMSIYFDNINLNDDNKFSEFKRNFPFLEEYIIDFGLEYVYDEEKEMHLSTISGGMENLVSFKGNLELGKMGEIWKEIKNAAQESRSISLSRGKANNVTLDSLSFDFYDKGMLEGLISTIAKKNNTTPKALREEAVFDIENNKNIPEKFKTEIIKYVQGEDENIKITINPKEDLTLSTLPLLIITPDKTELMNKFNVEIKSS